jgi:hypothetical protein
MRVLTVCLVLQFVAISGAEASPPYLPRVLIRVMDSKSCYISKAHVSCKAIAATLNDMKIIPADYVEVMGGPLDSVDEVLDTLKKAGYLNVIAFYEK